MKVRKNKQERRTGSAEKGEVRDCYFIKNRLRRPCFSRGGLTRDLKERREQTIGELWGCDSDTETAAQGCCDAAQISHLWVPSPWEESLILRQEFILNKKEGEGEKGKGVKGYCRFSLHQKLFFFLLSPLKAKFMKCY